MTVRYARPWRKKFVQCLKSTCTIVDEIQAFTWDEFESNICLFPCFVPYFRQTCTKRLPRTGLLRTLGKPFLNINGHVCLLMITRGCFLLNYFFESRWDIIETCLNSSTSVYNILTPSCINRRPTINKPSPQTSSPQAFAKRLTNVRAETTYLYRWLIEDLVPVTYQFKLPHLNPINAFQKQALHTFYRRSTNFNQARVLCKHLPNVCGKSR